MRVKEEFVQCDCCGSRQYGDNWQEVTFKTSSGKVIQFDACSPCLQGKPPTMVIKKICYFLRTGKWQRSKKHVND